jgi:hypothetical protein
MQYENEIIINLPRRRMLELFDNPDNMKHWQDGFVSFEPISGTPGEVGAKARLNYLMGKRKIELIETVTAKNLPDEFSGTYEAKGIWNKVENRFYALNDGQTRWVARTDFKLGGLMKLIGFLMPGTFKKQSLKMMEDFKKFAEAQ